MPIEDVGVTSDSIDGGSEWYPVFVKTLGGETVTIRVNDGMQVEEVKNFNDEESGAPAHVQRIIC